MTAFACEACGHPDIEHDGPTCYCGCRAYDGPVGIKLPKADPIMRHRPLSWSDIEADDAR